VTVREPTECGLCPWSQVFGDDETAMRKLAVHREQRHGELQRLPEPVTPVGQLAYPVFQVAYCEAVRALPVGTEFTTAGMHGRVADPLHKNYWGKAQAHAAHLGLVRPVTAQQSELGSTRRSLVLRWVRVEPAAKGGTA
jgi:hypothetical protein